MIMAKETKSKKPAKSGARPLDLVAQTEWRLGYEGPEPCLVPEEYLISGLGGSRRLRHSFSRLPETMSIPSLIELQRRSYDEFLQRGVPAPERRNVGLNGALQALFPVQDFSGKVQLEFAGYVLEEYKCDLVEARQKGLTYAAPLRAKLRLMGWDEEGGVRFMREQDVYLGDIPLMTQEGTFVINGIERVVVSQMHRSPGVFFDQDRSGYGMGKHLYLARIIPAMGSWVDFELDNKDVVCVRIDRKRKLPVTTLLMALEGALQDDPNAEPAKRQGMSRQEILQTFYDNVDFVHEDQSWAVPFTEALWDGVRLEEDLICAESGVLVAEKGEKLQKRFIRKKIQENITHVLVPFSFIVGRFSSRNLIDDSTGEVVVEAGAEITLDQAEMLVAKGIYTVGTLDINYVRTGPFLRNTLMGDKNTSRAEALYDIYRVLRPGETPTLENAYALFHNHFFNPEKYDLSDVGRLKINARLGLNSPLSERTLTKADFIAIVGYLLKLKQGEGSIDDIDSLTNRRVRSVGELLEVQYRSGLMRMQRTIRERMTAVDLETAMPNDLLNARPLSSIIREFFGTSQLSQFMDQTNPLSELNHKRRVSALGPGGLTRDRAGIEVRDVHPTHYGRICPVETPEGANIGLINSMAIYARINQYGFLETPYRRVTDGKLTRDVVYISAMEEEKYTIAPADVPLDDESRLMGDLIGCRQAGNYVLAPPSEIHFADVSPKQILSVAAGLIPFMDHNDATRALMGSNMQRQAVPLIKSRAPLVGTGIEGLVIQDSGVIVTAKRSGVIEQVEAARIVVRPDHFELGQPVVDVYTLEKFRKSNAGTCIHQRPIVTLGHKVKAGDILADGAATDRGELALGHNALVAFMSLDGLVFEDSIVLSSDLAAEDALTSIHIDEFDLSARDTKLGCEEITRDIPGVSEEAIRHLDESGIAYIGAEVSPGDILVGKVSPKAETPLTPEEKLLRAIFPDKAEDTKDSSLRVPAGVYGTVVNVRIFSRRGVERDERALAIEREMVLRFSQERDVERRILEQGYQASLRNLLIGQVLDQPFDGLPAGTALTAGHMTQILRGRHRKLALQDVASMKQMHDLHRQHEHAVEELQNRFKVRVEKLQRGDDLPTGVLKTVKISLAIKRKIQPGDKMAGRHGNKGVVSVIMPREDMPHLADGTPVDIVLNPLGLPSRMNVGQILETHLGWVSFQKGRHAKKLLAEAVQMDEVQGPDHLRTGLKQLYSRPVMQAHIDTMDAQSLLQLAHDTATGLPMATPVFEGAKTHEIEAMLSELGVDPRGQEILYDGKTGEPFDRPVTVGVLYMMKLHHLVDEKIHARSIGPYSLVTRQPLGGKSQFGGQRFGEMEVWSLQAYGAAYTLWEMLTVKSDDLQGRTEVYKGLIRGVESFVPSVPESFNVLVKELKTLGMNIVCTQRTPLKAG
jgi:DNA-directed RNA polymerase subunit beta